MKNFIAGLRRFCLKYDIACIAVLAFLLRALGRASSTYGSLGELYRDLIVEYKFLRLGTWPLLGPSSSLGGFNFGAVYYYLAAPFLWVFRFAPYGAVLASLLASVLAVVLLYKILMAWFGKKGLARLGALLLAMSFFDIQYSYYLSNPNIMPVFVLWFFYSLTMILKGSGKWRYYIGLGLSFGTATQLHATALLVLPLLLAIVLIRSRVKICLSRWLAALVSAACLFIPYAVYESGNGFSNSRGITHLGLAYLSLAIKPAAIPPIVAFWHSWLVFRSPVFDFLSINKPLFLVLLAVMAGLFLLLRYRQAAYQEQGFFALPGQEGKRILLWWLALSMIFFLMFQGASQAFYFLILWPLPIILFAWIIYWLKDNDRNLAGALVLAFTAAQAAQLAYFYPRVNQPEYAHANLLAGYRSLQQAAGGQSYNIVSSLADVNQANYYLFITGAESQLTRTGAKKLFILCRKTDPCLYNGTKYVLVKEFPLNGLWARQYELRGE
jgi:4-amino-4-deoxy-L-arabinose transferase-like glycosyltransferase